MASKPLYKMPRSERAKQFMPFAAVKGLPEALRLCEKISAPKRELSEDMLCELNEKFLMLQCGRTATVIYYKNYEYLKIKGTVSKIDLNRRVISIVNTAIPLDDISEIYPE